MVIYECERCGKIFKQKGHLRDHQNKINKCKEKSENKSNILEDNITKSLNLQISSQTMKEYLDECK